MRCWVAAVSIAAVLCLARTALAQGEYILVYGDAAVESHWSTPAAALGVGTVFYPGPITGDEPGAHGNLAVIVVGLSSPLGDGLLSLADSTLPVIVAHPDAWVALSLCGTPGGLVNSEVVIEAASGLTLGLSGTRIWDNSTDIGLCDSWSAGDVAMVDVGGEHPVLLSFAAGSDLHDGNPATGFRLLTGAFFEFGPSGDWMAFQMGSILSAARTPAVVILPSEVRKNTAFEASVTLTIADGNSEDLTNVTSTVSLFLVDTTSTGTSIVGGGSAVISPGGTYLYTSLTINQYCAACYLLVTCDFTTPCQPGRTPEFVVLNDAPQVISVEPNYGPAAGGQNITIVGGNFGINPDDLVAVKIGSLNCTSFEWVDTFEVYCTTPAQVAGTNHPVTITTVTGGSGGAPLAYHYGDPVVSAIAADNGPLALAPRVTITGTDFGYVFGDVLSITLGTIPCTSVTYNGLPTVLECKPGAALIPETVDVRVTTTAGLARYPGASDIEFTYNPRPALLGVYPSVLNYASTSVTINGTDLGVDAADVITIYIIGSPCTLNSQLSTFPTQLVCSVGTLVQGQTGTARVTTASGGGSMAFTGLSVARRPVISDVNPTAAPAAGGTPIVITGTDLGLSAADVVVRINGVTCTVVSSTDLPTALTIETPPGVAGIGTLTIATMSGGAAFSPSAFFYGLAPVVTLLQPAQGPPVGGVEIGLFGSNLGFDAADVVAVRLGGVNCSRFRINGLPDRIGVEIPPGMDNTLVDLVVETVSGGAETFKNFFRYTTAPFVTAATPVTGATAGGTVITLSGIFENGLVNSVTINGSDCGDVNATGLPTEISCTTSAGTAGLYEPIVTIDGTPGVSVALFIYAGIPTVASMTPPFIPADTGGVRVTLVGTDLPFSNTEVAGVSIGGLPCTAVVVGKPSETLSCDAPAIPTGSHVVQINTTGEIGDTSFLIEATDWPLIIAMDPVGAAGVVNGGTMLTFTGYNLDGAVSISIGAAPCATGLGSPSSVPCATGPSGPGTFPVSVGGGYASGLEFTYVLPPNVTAVNPTKGSATGGFEVTVIGSDFGIAASDLAGATLAGVACASFVRDSSTQVRCVAGAAPGNEDGFVGVAFASGGTVLSPVPFLYFGDPVVIDVEPGIGFRFGGYNVTVTGSGFGTEVADVTAVIIGDAACTVHSVSTSAIVCTLGRISVEGSHDVAVTTVFGSDVRVAAFTAQGCGGHNSGVCESCLEIDPSCGWCSFDNICGSNGGCGDYSPTCPRIDAIVPTRVPATGGYTLTISGSGFSATGGVTCSFDGVETALVPANDSVATCAIPSWLGPSVVEILFRRGNEDYDVDNNQEIPLEFYDCGGNSGICEDCLGIGDLCGFCPSSFACKASNQECAGSALLNSTGTCPRLFAVTPSLAPRNANFPLSFSGSNLFDPAAATLRCQFDGGGATLVETSAFVESASELTCTSPRLDPLLEVLPTQVSVTAGSSLFTNQSNFDFAFFDCGVAASCTACGTLNDACGWCGEEGGSGACQPLLSPCVGGNDVWITDCLKACAPGDDDAICTALITTGGSVDDDESEFPVVILVVVGGSLLCCLVLAAAAFVVFRGKGGDYVDDDDGATVRASDNALGTKVKAAMRKNSKRIGGGANSVVYKVKMDRETVCLKVITQDGRAARLEYQREVAALSRLVTQDHPAIVELKFFVKDDPICIAMEYCAGGDLKTYIRTKGSKLGAAAQTRLAFQIASGMAVVHGLGIAHLDLKTANILLDKAANAKICDFGISQLVTEEGYSVASSQDGFTIDRYETIDTMPPSGSATTNGSLEEPELAFTPQYVDPQRLAEDVGKIPTNLKTCDVFSFSLLVWAMASHAEPHADREPEAIVQRYRLDPGFRLDLPEDGDEALTEIIEECWDPRPAERPSFETLASRLGNILEVVHGTPLDRDYVRDLDTDRTIAYKTVNPVFEAGDSGGGSSSGALLLGDTAFDSVVHLPPPPPPVETDVMTMVPPPPPPDGSTLMTMVPPPPPPDGSTLMTMVPPPPPPDSSTLMTMVPPPPPPEAGDGVEMSTFSG